MAYGEQVFRVLGLVDQGERCKIDDAYDQININLSLLDVLNARLDLISLVQKLKLFHVRKVYVEILEPT